MNNELSVTMTNGNYINSNGNEVTNSGSASTGFTPVIPGLVLRLSNLYLSGARSACFYNSNNEKVSEIEHNDSDTEVIAVVPYNASFVRATSKVNESVKLSYLIKDSEANLSTNLLVLSNDAKQLTPLILGSYQGYVNVTITSDAATIEIPADTIAILRNGSWRQIVSGSDSVTVDIFINNKSAIKLLYDLDNDSFSAVTYSETVANNQILIATFRVNSSNPSVSISCPYKLNGKLYGIKLPETEVLTPLILGNVAQNYVDFEISSLESHVTFPGDTLAILGNGIYKQIVPANNPITISLENNNHTAAKIVYDLSSESFSVINYNVAISENQILIASVRTMTRYPSISIACPYRVNGLLYGVSQDDIVNYKNNVVKAIAHRGNSEIAPENTLIAFKSAKKAHFDYVECDVAFTSDGVPVLLHDSTINRTARNEDGTELSETIYIKDITYTQALTYDFGIWFNSSFSGTKIPTLEQFFGLCRNLGLHPYVEIKNTETYTQNQVETIVDLSKKYGLSGKITWISYTLQYLMYVKNYDPNARLGYVINEITQQSITDALSLKNATNEVFIDARYIYFTDELIQLVINSGLPLETWSVNSEQYATPLNPYVTGITTNGVNIHKVLYEYTMSEN